MNCDVIETKKSANLAGDIGKWLSDHPSAKIVQMNNMESFGLGMAKAPKILTIILWEA